LLYNLFLTLYAWGIKLASLWNPKARKWVKGRMGILTTINNSFKNQSNSNHATTVWMHCASLGEFEQGRPLLEALKHNHSKVKIVLTFFSPSGYEVMKAYDGADFIFYLPMDSPGHAKKFLDAVNPTLVLWVKYEYWFYYLKELKNRQIPTMLVSGIFRKNQPFFKWYGAFWRKMLGSFTHFFLQNEASIKLLGDLGFNDNITLTGDTRYDRVLEIANNFKTVPYIDQFCGDNQVVVAGSTWEEDELELLHFVQVHPNIKFIIAPHEIDQPNLINLKTLFPDSILYSALGNKNIESTEKPELLPHVLIIDNVGLLSRLYHYATVAYVGGGFGADGVHNVLEAAVYGKPVVFGPVYEKFDEAIGLLEAGGGFSIDAGPVKLESVLNGLLQHEMERKKTGDAARQFVLNNAGASQKIIEFLQEKRLLTS
jgi:3-deoxy-D-manno-octulosonic-acid transferase